MADAVKTKYLEITRVFNAPREKVWKAWTDPTEYMKWWGPEHFHSPKAEIDLREGGKIFNVMEGDPDSGDFAGKRFYGTGVFKEIVPMEKLVMTDSFSDAEGHKVSPKDIMPGMENWPEEATVTVTFEDAGPGKTKLTLKHGPFPEGDMFTNTNEGWNSSLDKLAKSVA